MDLGNANDNDHKVSDTINYLIFSEVKKIVKKRDGRDKNFS